MEPATKAQEIISEAVNALPKAAGIEASDIRYASKDEAFDGWIDFTRDGQTHTWVFETKSRIRPSLVPLLSDHRRRRKPEHPLLLVTDHVTPGVAKDLQAAGIAFIDSAGNVSLESPDWYVWVVGNRRRPRASLHKGLGPAVWKVTYLILREPSSASLPVRELGARAGVSPGAVSTALKSLEARGWVRRMGRSGTVARDLEALHNAWEVGYLDRLRPRQYVTQARPHDATLQSWAESVVSADLPGVLIGGELAAERARLGVVAATGAVHLPSWGAPAMKALRLLPSETGPVAVLKTFGTCNHSSQWQGSTDPLLVRAELLSIQDERLDGVRTRLLGLITARW